MENVDYSKGFIILPRNLLDTWIWLNKTYIQLWIEMVCAASWHDYTEIINGNEVLIKRGELRLTLYALCKKYNIDKRTVKRFLELLESKNWIKTEKRNKTIIFNIIDIDYYQPIVDKNNEQNDLLSFLGGVNSMHPQMHRNLHPQAHPNMHPLKENEENFINDCETEYCSINTVLLEDGNCTQNCTQNCTHDWQKNAPTNIINKINKINNNIFNNNNNTIGRVCERAREDVFAESNEVTSGFQKEQSDINLLYLVKQDSRWIRAVQNIFNLSTVEDVEKSLDYFWSELIVKGIDSHESLTDFKSHYYGWMRIQQGLDEKKNKNNEQNNRYYNDYSKRRPAPVSTKFPKEEDFRF